MLWNSAGDGNVKQIWEISPAGITIRKWDFSDNRLYYPSSPNSTYLSPGRVLIFSSQGTQRAVQRVKLNNDLTYVVEKTWLWPGVPTIGRMQSVKYKNGVFYILIDDKITVKWSGINSMMMAQ